MGSDSKKTVKKNVLALLRHAAGGELPEGQSGVSRLKALGVSQGNAQRALDDDSDIRLATLDQLAKGFRIRPWQLLVPDIDPTGLPTLAGTGSPTEPLSSEHRLTDSPKSGPEAETVFDGLDRPGRELLGDIVSVVRRRLLPSGEQAVGRDSSWSNESASQGQQAAEASPKKPRGLR